MSSNRITGTLPSSLGSLPRLKTLKASHNQLSGIPSELLRSAQLAEVLFGGNVFQGIKQTDVSLWVVVRMCGGGIFGGDYPWWPFVH